jgi:hypothetical protein
MVILRWHILVVDNLNGKLGEVGDEGRVPLEVTHGRNTYGGWGS